MCRIQASMISHRLQEISYDLGDNLQGNGIFGLSNF
jgi:hypothetical protein